MGDALKTSFRVTMQTTRREQFNEEGGFSAILKFYCKSYWLL